MFLDRSDAGNQLAERLRRLPVVKRAKNDDLLVLSIPRGGAIVGQALANALGCPHTVIVVRKIGLPGNEELAVGAISEDGQVFLDREALRLYQTDMERLESVVAQARERVARYVSVFRGGEPLSLADKIVILTDDGVATGETMKAAVRSIRVVGGVRRFIVAVPVCARRAARELRAQVDAFVSLYLPRDFLAVGQFYWRFPQVSDEEVLAVLGDAHPG